MGKECGGERDDGEETKMVQFIRVCTRVYNSDQSINIIYILGEGKNKKIQNVHLIQ